ncbi:hypothetical protein WH221_05850 [Chryseobacterium culicis]|uniref:Uncharacterized protein n=1 Tax=Chryseobacterium culicis TaxID=680127 RepID=A0A2S9CZ83_CHRCI|nr:hypothetical protein [Chryseobacterium culicis]PRB85770.1 hypothetical protein CQ022_05810 [Chryseobacterium culicis]PRB90506.1 hypothetical protein CQ033_07175 [Chryseobacterium culicis]
MNIIYNNFKSLCVKAFFIGSLLLSVLPKAQLITFHFTWNWSANDLLSKTYYKDMASAHRKLEAYAITKTGVVARTKDIYIEPNKELTRISSGLTSKKDDMLKFLSGTSYDYIKDKYPIVAVSPLASGKLSNALVRRRFKKKFDAEKENITNYLDTTNYIPEGERLRLIQQALDKVIRVTLEDENY